ncbi:hypothetical protein [Acaryochloris marina]|nr:hypothetical protein [Acaryochloris marina]
MEFRIPQAFGKDFFVSECSKSRFEFAKGVVAIATAIRSPPQTF